VSTGLQNSDLQTDALTQHGCTKIFHDKLSETKKQRHDLEEAHQDAREGDTIVVRRLDHLGLNMQDLIQIENSLNELGIGFHSLPKKPNNGQKQCNGQDGTSMEHIFIYGV
jgi:DNA invertase Pin-like site-specific DNA recombinase